MRNLFIFFVLTTSLFVPTLNAQTLAQWTFENVNTPTTTPTNGSASNAVWRDNLSVSYAAGNGSAAAINASGFATTFNAAEGYMEFSIAPNVSFALNLTQLTFDERRSNTGPTNWAIRSSRDNFAADIATGLNGTTFASETVTLNSTFQNVQAGITFRLYGYGASGTAGTLRIDNLTIAGTITAVTGPSVVASKSAITLAETPQGIPSVAETFTIGGGNLTNNIGLTAPAGFEISLSATTGFTTNLTLTQTSGNVATTTIYIRQTATTAGTLTGNLVATSGSTTQNIALSGITRPTNGDGTFEQSNTLDIVAWNVEWFGHPTEGPSNNARQQNNVNWVMQTLKADLFQVSEVSDEALFAQTVATMPAYTYTCSYETSYSNVPPADPMSQKLCFVYKTGMFSNVQTTSLLTTFKYDNNLILNYPDPLPSRFWASGRLPYMLTADVTVNGITKRIGFVGIHARANSSSDDPIGRYNMRKYDIEKLKEPLDNQYANLPFVLLGDFNDDLDFTVVSGISGSVTSYIEYKNDNARYAMTTLPLSLAGLRSTVGFNSVIDHIVSSNEMASAYISSSARLANTTDYISSYGSTTTDHFPVMARYDIVNISLPVEWLSFTGKTDGKTANLLNWATATERNASHFLVERSDDGKNFSFIGEVKATGGTTTTPQYYDFRDESPTAALHFYRLRQVDRDGKQQFSTTVTIKRSDIAAKLVVFPNPSADVVNFTLSENSNWTGTARLFDANGRLVKTTTQMPQIPIANLANGIYILEVQQNNGQVFREKVFVNH
jgi:trimeric autotransporter adhesin